VRILWGTRNRELNVLHPEGGKSTRENRNTVYRVGSRREAGQVPKAISTFKKKRSQVSIESNNKMPGASGLHRADGAEKNDSGGDQEGRWETEKGELKTSEGTCSEGGNLRKYNQEC